MRTMKVVKTRNCLITALYMRFFRNAKKLVVLTGTARIVGLHFGVISRKGHFIHFRSNKKHDGCSPFFVKGNIYGECKRKYFSVFSKRIICSF